ncbi:MAG: hypothetical protein GX910_05045 [Clostridiaceae bacterium]|jgi:transposase-like protein|nr:hypothetical protein [Clostridiaceae bacterium]
MSEKIIQLNEGVIKEELNELVRKSVEDTLNVLLEEEADRLTNARRYERTAARKDTRAGHYKRKLLTRAGEVELKMPKLRTLTFETAIIQRYQKREISVEEALVEMYLAGVSVRRVEDITQALWGTRVSAGTVSRLNREIRRRTRVVGAFPDGHSALMLVCARLRYMENSMWGSKLYMNMKHLETHEQEIKEERGA